MSASNIVYPSIIAASTAIFIFVAKEWFLVRHQRKVFGTKLLHHSCSTLSKVLEMNPAIIDFRPPSLETYIEVYLTNNELQSALDSLLEVYYLWRSGVFVSGDTNIILDAKEKLSLAMKGCNKYIK